MTANGLSRLSYDQEWSWKSMTYGPHLAAARLSFKFAGEGGADMERLVRAVYGTWAAHPVLRSEFSMRRDMPVQQAAAEAAGAQRWLRNDSGRTWVIESGSAQSPHFVTHPLFRAEVQAGSGTWAVQVSACPLIFDVASIAIWTEELRRRWAGGAAAAGADAAAGTDMAGLIVGERLAARRSAPARTALIERLKGARRYRPMPATGESPAPGHVLTRCQTVVPDVPAGAVPDDVRVAAGLSAAIFRLTGLADAAFAVRTDVRTAAAGAGVLGPLSRLIAVRPAISPDMGLSGVTDALAAALAAADTARNVPLQDILLAIPGGDDDPEAGPVLPLVLERTPLPAGGLALPGAGAGADPAWQLGVPLNELAIYYARSSDDLILRAAYDPLVYEPYFVAGFLDAVRRVLAGWTWDPCATLATLPVADFSVVTSGSARPAVGPADRLALAASMARTGRAWADRVRDMGLAPSTLAAVTCDGSEECAAVILGCLEAGLTVLPLEEQDPRRHRRWLAAEAGCGALVERRGDGEFAVVTLGASPRADEPDGPHGALRMCVRTLPHPVFADVPAAYLLRLAARIRDALGVGDGDAAVLEGARGSLWALAHVLAVTWSGGRVEWADAVAHEGKRGVARVVVTGADGGLRAVSASVAEEGTARRPDAPVVVESLVAPEGFAAVRAARRGDPEGHVLAPGDVVFGAACVLDELSRPLPAGAEGTVHAVVPREIAIVGEGARQIAPVLSAQDGSDVRVVDLGLSGYLGAGGNLTVTDRIGGRAEIGGRIMRLGEIEGCLLGTEGVLDAAAAPVSLPDGVASVVLVELAADSKLSTESLWTVLLRRAPGAILPDHVEVDRSGFLRGAIRAHPSRMRRARRIRAHMALTMETPYVAPETDMEERVARAVVEPCLPPGSRAGRYDNFFHLGGSSLGIVKMVTLAEQEFGVLLNAAALFGEPRLIDISALIERQLAAADSAQQTLKSIESLSDAEVGDALRMLQGGQSG
jgi:hypothetical protein